ncbi:histidine kinase [uncultured Aquimarina sp.]|uniref:sensor histidine kinase n=1 Tax=uncultured Aquimarina sp. TaxID=575652 RepID=UPI00262E1C90|nr:histidine kinase [uncultured Aquimarina sp.]
MLQLSHKTIQTIKITFNAVFIGFITFSLLRRAFVSLPDNWLFFLTSDAVENFLCAFIGYSLYYYILKLKGIWKKIGYIILFVILLITLASLKNYRIQERIETEMLSNEKEDKVQVNKEVFLSEINKLKNSFHQKRKSDGSRKIFEYFTSFLGQVLLFYSLIYFVNRLEYLNRYRKLENELNQTKAQLLRNQLHPHFLFNAFNSLYSLSLKNHPDTSDYILKLSSMMRYLTDETDLNKVPLTKELDFIKKYIAIEKIRFGKDARIKLTINNTINDSIFIEPFLLITLVENAFKHGFYTNSKDAFVNINLNIENNELLFTVENSLFNKQHFQESSRKGKGLKNLKQRLQLLYPKKSSLHISSTKENYTTQLKITLT